MPRNLVEKAEQHGRQAWLSALPAIVRDVSEAWSLKVGEPFQPGGETAWVAPAEDASGAQLALKIAWCHPESSHEAAGLLAWNGTGAVRLHACQELASPWRSCWSDACLAPLWQVAKNRTRTS